MGRFFDTNYTLDADGAKTNRNIAAEKLIYGFGI